MCVYSRREIFVQFGFFSCFFQFSKIVLNEIPFTLCLILRSDSKTNFLDFLILFGTKFLSFLHLTSSPFTGYVTKKCGPNGDSWYTLNGREWSNYTNCARDDVSGFSLSSSFSSSSLSFSYFSFISSSPHFENFHKYIIKIINFDKFSIRYTSDDFGTQS